MQYTDIDERRNRIEVGTLDMLDAELLRLLHESDVPRDALIVKQASEIHLLGTLNQKHRPTFGGLEVHVQESGNPRCSLGFNGVLSGDTITMTAGHCDTEAWGSDRDANLYQYLIAGSHKIGVERAEASFFSNSVDPACPSSNNVCRYEDVALFDVDPGVGALMKVAWVTACGEGSNDPGSVTLTTGKTWTCLLYTSPSPRD